MGTQRPQTRAGTKTGTISLTNPDVVSLLHEVVISLCQRKYSSLPGVEVDGIICISFADTTEQQVVKIHETLNTDTREFCKTIDSKAVSKPDSSKSDINEQVINKPDTTNKHKSPSHVDFQREITNLSDLLKSSNEMCARNAQSPAVGNSTPPFDQQEKTRKRKRKPVRNLNAGLAHENDRAIAKIDATPSLPTTSTASDIKTTKDKIPASSDAYNEALADISDSNLLIVKEEVQDETYNSALCPKIVSLVSEKDKQESVSSTEKEVHIGNIPTSNGHVTSSADSVTGKGDKNSDPSRADEDFNFPVQVKTEKVDNGYEAAYGLANSLYEHSDYNQATTNQQNVFPNSDSQGYSPLEHSDDGCSKDSDTGDMSDNIMAPYLGNQFDNDEPETKKKRMEFKEKTDGKLWNEMITTNVSRYQAALMTGKIKPTGQEPNPAVQSQVREMLDIKSMVKNYIKSGMTDFDNNVAETPSIKIEDVSDDNGNESLSTPQCEDKESQRERSTSQPRSTQGDERASHSSVATATNPDKSDEMAEERQGELGTRYPSLFNQLQKIKASSSTTDTTKQPESLLNRLPFISFQELFSGASNDTKNKSQIAGLLMSQSPERTSAKPTPAPVVKTGPAFLKKQWNWKKRVVRPRGPDGEILSPDKYALIPEVCPKTTKSNRTKSNAKSEDREWHPSCEDLWTVSQEKTVTPVVSTRLSSGEKVRKSFVEIESDFDVDTPDEEDEIQFLSAYCPKGCGAKFTTVEAMNIHEDTCMCEGGKDFRCDICGLDFNQQYRWQYHMIKVHGITPNSSMLFR